MVPEGSLSSGVRNAMVQKIRILKFKRLFCKFPEFTEVFIFVSDLLWKNHSWILFVDKQVQKNESIRKI